MANTNDARILEMKKKIEEKKKELSKAVRFVPTTNCSLELDGVRTNIRTLQKEGLTMLLVKLNSIRLSAIDLGMVDANKNVVLEISGYNVIDWIFDISNFLYILDRKSEERKLKLMEDKLQQLLSEDKKVELELDEIASFLN